MSTAPASSALAHRIRDEIRRAHRDCHREHCPSAALWAEDIQEVLDIAFVQASACCDLHGRACEPPSELCCEACTEAAHPGHDDGSRCSSPNVSGDGSVVR